MPEYETNQGRVVIDEVERIIRPDGNNVSIMKVQSHRLEAIEGVVCFLRNSGMFFPVRGYKEVRNPQEYERTLEGREPITVYLSCPVSDIQHDIALN